MNTLGNLKTKRRVPNPRTIKKHSDIVRRDNTRLIVGGSREKTETGYIAKGFLGKSFETSFETMLARTATAVLCHPKKDKVIRIISGILFVITKIDGHETQQRFIAGDEIVLERGTTYRLSTAQEDVDMFVANSAKYDIALEVIDSSSLVTQEISPNLLEEPTIHQRIASSRPHEAISLRKGSKAKEQLLAQRTNRKQVQPLVPEPVPGRQGAMVGKNPRPTAGKFSEDGAG